MKKVKKKYGKPITKNVVLPTSIVNLIESMWDSNSELERVRNRNVIAYRIVALIYSEQKTKDYYVAIPSKYYMKLFASTYREILQKLLDSNVIETFASKTSQASYITTETAIRYSGNPKATGMSKKYRIVKEHFIPLLDLTDEISTSTYIVYKNNYKEPIKKRETNRSVNNSSIKKYKSGTQVKITYSPKKSAEKYEKEFIDTVSTLNIDILKIESASKKKVNSLNVDNYVQKTEKEEGDNRYVKVLFLNSKRKRYMSFKLYRLKEEVRRDGVTLFKDKDYYYVGTLEQFRDYKKHNMTVSYFETLNALKTSDFYAKRNGSNNRLDTNFTNMPNFMLDIIKEDNNLISLDLANSQLSILAYILENSNIKDKEDFLRFKKDCYSGEIYDKVSEILNISRKESKVGFFEVLFGKVGTEYRFKNLLKELYPNVIEWTDKYKKENTYKCLAKLLQKKESEMFIDNIYENLLKKDILVLTKHDSVIVREKDEVLVREEIEKYFKSIGFKGKMKKE